MPVKLFIPCLLDQMAPDTAAAAAALLHRLKAPFEYPPDQTCCGQFAFTIGDFPTARRLMRHFVRVFLGAEAIVCPGASCAHMVRRHYPALAESPGEREEVARLAARTFELGEFLAAQGPLPWQPRFPGALALHRSCKARELGVFEAARSVLSQVKDLEINTLSPHFSCCGFGGAFKGQQPELAREIGAAYLAAVADTGARGLIFLDHGCLMHLKGVAAGAGLPLTFHHLAEVLLAS